MKNDLLKKYNNIFNVLTETKGYIGSESVGFSDGFMISLDFLIRECLKEIESLNIYEEKKVKETEQKPD